MKNGRSWVLLGLAVLAGLGLAVGVAAGVFFYVAILSDLPDLERVEDYQPALATTVYARDGRPIGEFFEERRRLVPLEAIPEHVIQAFIASEDDAFFEHEGLDYRSMVRAAWVDLTAGEIVQGASTITQQTVKSLLLTPERRWERKLKEIVLARRLEQQLDKGEILYLYLNQIYFGSGAYGIGEAARTYFGKTVEELAPGEGALLAGLPKAPSAFSPRKNPAAAERRRQYVLGRMHALGYLDDAAYAEAKDAPPELHDPPELADFETATWFAEEVRRLLFERLEGEQVLRGGLRVETTLDLELQAEATRALREGLVALDHRQGWTGPVRRVPDAVDAEVVVLGEQNGLDADAAGPFDPERAWLGVVTGLDAEAGTARVALAPGVAGTVALEDASWARPRDPSKRIPFRRKIAEVFTVGDVARFQIKPGTYDPSPDQSTPSNPVDGTPASAEGARSEAKPSEVHQAGARTEPEPGEVHQISAEDAFAQLVLHQEPQVEGAIVALGAEGGEVRALVGGYDYRRSQFDRAVQARRQPGSAFKPLIYATALTRGYTPVTTLYDRPVVYTDQESGFTWRPENYGRSFLGPLPLREALARSVNNATIHLLKDVGVRSVIATSRRLGIRSPLEANLSLALGASPVSPLELTAAYAALPAGGNRVDPVFIRRVVDRDGNVLLESVVLDGAPEQDVAAAPEADEPTIEPAEPEEAVLTPAEAYLAVDVLRGVVDHPRGTGRKAKALGRPLAGKTGTTNDHGDAWFVGFSAELTTGVWVGFDERQVLGRGETGGRAALPIWIDFMGAAHEGHEARDFPVPAGVSFARIDAATHKLADRSSGETYFQAFLDGTVPTETSSEVLSATESRNLRRLDF